MECRDSVTFHKLTAWITRFVNIVIGDTSDSGMPPLEWFYRENTENTAENRTRCNTGGEIKQDLVEYK